MKALAAHPHIFIGAAPPIPVETAMRVPGRPEWFRLQRTALLVSVILSAASVLASCSSDYNDNKSSSKKAVACEIEPNLDISVCEASAANFAAPTTIDNAFFPLEVSTVLTLDGEEEGQPLNLVIEVMNETEMVGDIETRVVNETVTSGDAMVEFAVNYFAQSNSGDVCYFGESVDNYENDKLANHDGSWRADEDGNQPGIVMPAEPAKGDAYEQEVAADIAEDRAEITAVGDELKTPLDTYTDTITTSECTPLEDNSYETKVYVSGIGVAFDNGLELTAVEAP
jgi:hypothetical protein